MNRARARAWTGWLWTGLVAASCAGPPVELDEAYGAGGVALGMQAPVVVRLTVAGMAEEVRVPGDGAFAFATSLHDGDDYSMAVADSSGCGLASGERAVDGVVAGSDVMLALTCPGVVGLAGVSLSGARGLGVVAMPGLYDHDAAVPVVQDSARISLMARYPELASVRLMGADIDHGTASEPIALTGANGSVAPVSVDIDVDYQSSERGLWHARHSLTMARSAAPVEHAYIKASNPNAQDQFGGALALSADGLTLAVGARYEASAAAGVDAPGNDNSAPGSGAVYVFSRDVSEVGQTGGEWRQVAYIKASNPDGDDNFGHSVALSAAGDILIVGAPGEGSAAMGAGGGPGEQADNSEPGRGAAYVFVRTPCQRADVPSEFASGLPLSSPSWRQAAYVKASNAGGAFGWSVAVSADGDVFAVGATTEASAATGIDGDQGDTSAPGAGAVYVFARDGDADGWRQEAYVKAENSGMNDRFGGALALSAAGDVLAVGAYGEDGDGSVPGDDSVPQSGAVYMFARTDGEGWASDGYIKAAVGDAGDLFGARVALSGSGDWLAVAALGEDGAAQGPHAGDGGAAAGDNGAQDSGAVYVFAREVGMWQQRAYIKTVNAGAGDGFGGALGLSQSGDALVVGAPGEADASGALYVLVRADGAWTHRAHLQATNSDPGDRLGDALGLSASAGMVLVGAGHEASRATGVGGDPLDDTRPQSGAVYSFW